MFGLDDTIERRRGAQSKAKGIYRDPVRSSHSNFVKASGLRWLSCLLLVSVSWASAIWGLPFLTVLCPSERYYQARRRAHQKLTERAWQMIALLSRWLPDRVLVFVADSCCCRVCLAGSSQSSQERQLDHAAAHGCTVG